MKAPAAALVAPAVILASFVVIGGLVTVGAQSLGLLPLAGEPEPGMQAYVAVSADLPSALGLSLAIATVSAVVAAVVGLSAALVIVQGSFGARWVAAVSALTIPLPHIVGAASIGLLLSDSGVLARLTGAGDAWPQLVGGPTWFAVVAEYSWKESAFVALVVTGALVTRSAGYTETAALLGASRFRRLRHVLLPFSLPALGASSLIVFIYTFGSYEVAWLLGRAYPEPLPVMALRIFGLASLDSRPEAAALAMISALVSLGIAVLGFMVLRRLPLWR